ncbi:hypothetical protein LOD99_11052 [Oopsacas minuta]|uniref:Uncharacterized protein n=1 Tax=Oopsacas minuta TaxID=111878 RepID=A0AAV7KB08_9METZ|nr:hypothetical protein LOD99_11052 [Oopsacas minuta]
MDKKERILENYFSKVPIEATQIVHKPDSTELSLISDQTYDSHKEVHTSSAHPTHQPFTLQNAKESSTLLMTNSASSTQFHTGTFHQVELIPQNTETSISESNISSKEVHSDIPTIYSTDKWLEKENVSLAVL